MNNELRLIKKLKINMKLDNKMRVIIDGRKVKSKNDFLKIMEESFLFPESCHGNLDIFMDYIRDLSWINHSKIELIVKNQSDFLRDDQNLRDMIIECFQEEILPYWQKEVLETMVHGKCKEFSVFLVDEQIIQVGKKKKEYPVTE